jgi:FkbM family methyltransferase
MPRISRILIKFLRPRNYFLFVLWRLKMAQILIHSSRLNFKLRKANQRALFLDCGSNIGQGFEFFRKFYPLEHFDFILFEPNPYCFKILEQKYSNFHPKGVMLINAAVGTKEGQIDFYGLDDTEGGIYSVGGSILPEHNSRIYLTPRSSSLKVNSINFNDFLRDLIGKKKYSTIVLKLDIEGGEYEILDSLQDKHLLTLFESIYVEFHSQYMSPDLASYYIDSEKEFLKYAKKIGTRVVKWI